MVAPSVVKISAGQNGASGVMTRHGVLTNDHVVTGLTEVEVVGSDGTQRTATVVRSDPWYDLALLSTDLSIPALELEPARSHRQGDPLLAMGYPFAQFLEGPPSLSRGILSAIREIEGVTYVQTDAAMNFGSSGGAIVNTRGKLVALARGGLGSFGGINFGVGAESIDGFVAGVVIVGPDSAEPDDAMDQARPLRVGADAEEHNFHRPGDIDWVVLQLVEDESVVVFTDSPRCDTYMALIGPDGVTVLAEDDDGGGNVSSAIAFTATESGAYYARVSHFEPQGRCRAYNLGASAGTPSIGPDDDEEEDGEMLSRPKELLVESVEKQQDQL
jgi:hypothetical protein